MSTNSKIQWTDHTFNPWIGCAKVSAGCKHCYAEQLMDTRYGRVTWGEKGTRVRTMQPWRDVFRWQAQAVREGRRFSVFTASLADIFEDRPELALWRNEVWDLVHRCDRLDFQLLTKRPQNVMRMVPPSWHTRWPTNAWLGTSVEDQAAADERIPHLLRCPAAVRFISAEPLLGPVDLQQACVKACPNGGRCVLDSRTGHRIIQDSSEGGIWIECACSRLAGIGWVIIGGESGPRARPTNIEWIRSVVQQCKAAGVPVFVKQLGARPVTSRTVSTVPLHIEEEGLCLVDRKGGDPAEWPKDLRVRELPEVCNA
jgi:protein gp37